MPAQIRSSRTRKHADIEPASTPGEPEPRTVYRLLHYVIVPLVLMVLTPNLVVLLWYLCQRCDGSVEVLHQVLTRDGTSFAAGVLSVWRESGGVTAFSVGVVLVFSAWSALTMLVIPGKPFRGPVTPNGNVPHYRDNGFYCYVISMVLLHVISRFYDVTIIYDRFGEIIVTLCVFSLVFCLVLYVKGLKYPSSSDCGSSGYLIFDYYWGTELHPRILGMDVKTFTNCRFGLTAWAGLVVIFAMKSYRLYGFVDSMMVSAFLQLAYLTKFFWWERGYMSTIDIMVDRAGYYICWGCLVFIPGFLSSVSHYLVLHPVQLGSVLSGSILLAGVWSLGFNYMADRQKQTARDTNGNCVIWGQKARFITAHYRLSNGEKRTSILLLSGFWGQARHFNYLAELTFSFCLTLPCLFENVFPYSYFIFLCILLYHRSFRDDDKCSRKYGKYWDEYRQQVPYRIIPGVF